MERIELTASIVRVWRPYKRRVCQLRHMLIGRTALLEAFRSYPHQRGDLETMTLFLRHPILNAIFPVVKPVLLRNRREEESRLYFLHLKNADNLRIRSDHQVTREAGFRFSNRPQFQFDFIFHEGFYPLPLRLVNKTGEFSPSPAADGC